MSFHQTGEDRNHDHLDLRSDGRGETRNAKAWIDAARANFEKSRRRVGGQGQ
jgi:hypothetical protein